MNDEKDSEEGVTRRKFLTTTAVGATAAIGVGKVPLGAAVGTGAHVTSAVATPSTVVGQYLEALQRVSEIKEDFPDASLIRVAPINEMLQNKYKKVMEEHGFSSDTFDVLSADSSAVDDFHGLVDMAENKERRPEMKENASDYYSNMQMLHNVMCNIRRVRALQRSPEILVAFREIAESVNREYDATQELQASHIMPQRTLDQLKQDVQSLSDCTISFLDAATLIRAADTMEKWVDGELKQMQTWPDDAMKTDIALLHVLSPEDIPDNISSLNIRIGSLMSSSRMQPSVGYAGQKILAPSLDVLRLSADSAILEETSSRGLGHHSSRGLGYNADGQLSFRGANTQLHYDNELEHRNTAQAALRELHKNYIMQNPIDPNSPDAIGAIDVINRSIEGSTLISHPFIMDEVPVGEEKKWLASLVQENKGIWGRLTDEATNALNVIDINMSKLTPEQCLLATMRADAIVRAIDGVAMQHSEAEDGTPQLQLTISDPVLVEALSENSNVDTALKSVDVIVDTPAKEQDFPSAGSSHI